MCSSQNTWQILFSTITLETILEKQPSTENGIIPGGSREAIWIGVVSYSPFSDECGCRQIYRLHLSYPFLPPMNFEAAGSSSIVTSRQRYKVRIARVTFTSNAQANLKKNIIIRHPAFCCTQESFRKRFV